MRGEGKTGVMIEEARKEQLRVLPAGMLHLLPCYVIYPVWCSGVLGGRVCAFLSPLSFLLPWLAIH